MPVWCSPSTPRPSRSALGTAASNQDSYMGQTVRRDGLGRDLSRGAEMTGRIRFLWAGLLAAAFGGISCPLTSLVARDYSRPQGFK
jgi:hypothetical protein